MAADTEEAGACWKQESSTCLSEQVAANITPPSASCAVNSRVIDAKLETPEHAGEVIRVPGVAEYQGDGDRLRVLTGPKLAWRSSQQLLEVVVDVQLLQDSLDERVRPSERLRRGDRGADGRRAGVTTPAASGPVRRARGTTPGVRLRGARRGWTPPGSGLSA